MQATSDYGAFLQHKAIVDAPTGLVDLPPLPDALFDFQRDITKWALRRGRAAVFAGTGLGKSLIELSWGQAVHQSTGRDVILLTPLAVAAQMVREAAKFGISAKQCRTQADVEPGITVTNYEKLGHFNIAHFGAAIFDESSIIKNSDGKTRNILIKSFEQIPFRLAATATPAPNDFMELGNHAELLGVMRLPEMLSTFFVHDGGDTSHWRLKKHARTEFWRWMCSWSVMLRLPSDLGYENGAFDLPPLRYHQHVVAVEQKPIGDFLFPMPAQTLQERQAARRETITDRVALAASIVNANADTWAVWCNLNAEGNALTTLIDGAVQVAGADSEDEKAERLDAFSCSLTRVMVSKPKCAGFGLNWQHCHKVLFVGLNDSWEQVYQSIRRCWRFGQTDPVDVHFITGELEGAVVANIQRKEQQAEEMAQEMVANMHNLNEESLRGTVRDHAQHVEDRADGDGWTLHLGDCVDMARQLASESIHYSVYSPPFASLYTYSASDRDMGNCGSTEMFFNHYQFIIREIFRLTMPGRLTSVHCMNLPVMKAHAGYIGIRDFRGDVIRAHESEGWIFHSEVCIWKDPVTSMQRTKALGLLHKQIVKDSSMSRQGIPDYVITMRKPGDNPERITGALDAYVGTNAPRKEFTTRTDTRNPFSIAVWQQYASPVWMDINPSDTLQFRSAREHEDERHICPLQLDVIRRCIQLWSNSGDLVMDPFAGIGSTGVVALEMGRRFVGAELKASYWEQARRNLAEVAKPGQQSLGLA